MKNARKWSMAGLALAVMLSLAPAAMAKGTETAPGQAVNFSKGITTLISFKDVVTNSERVNTSVSTTSSTERKSSIVEELVTTTTTITEKHPQHDQYRDVVTTTTKKIITTTSWDETTNVTTTTTTVTPITTTQNVKTTLMHQGAPGSNGKVLSTVTENIGQAIDVEGESVVTTNVETEVIEGEKSVSVSEVIISENKETSGWKIGLNK